MLVIGVLLLSCWDRSLSAQEGAPTSRQPQPSSASTVDSQHPYVNSGGLRLRDFPSTTDGAILATLQQGVRLNILASTAWKDSIGQTSSPWYLVSILDGSGRTGWVYGAFVSFENGFEAPYRNVQTLSRQQMNGALLVLQMFRRLLGTETARVSISWLQGLKFSAGTTVGQNSPAEYSLRTYETDFGSILVRFTPYLDRQLVLSITVDKPTKGLLLAVGEPSTQAQLLLGSDYYRQHGALVYRPIQYVDTYGLSIREEGGRIAAITAGAILQ